MEEILRKLISFPTVSGDAYAMHQLLNYVAAFVSRRGMHVEWFESNGFESIVATVVPGKKNAKVMLAAHADVVPADEELFELRKRDGAYFGRGVMDMKGALAAYLQIIDDIQDRLQDYDICLVVTTDEEVGGKNGTAKLIQEGYIPEVCIIPDGGEQWQVPTLTKGFWAFDISAEGKTAHGSRPWLGVHALDRLLGGLAEIRTLFPAPEDMDFDSNTLTLARVEAGTPGVYNQVPDRASMTIDVRTAAVEDYERLYTEIVKICDKHNLTYSNPADGYPAAFDLKNELIAPFVRHIEAVTGVTVTGSRTLGSNDTRYFTPHGVQCISFYPEGNDLHGPGEYLVVEGLEQMREVIARYLEEIARN
jgi:acetylornithine deacetylase/succinyl-diaminopimelate desuccinylase-like protein